jgi:hypothetical protein
MSEIEEVICPLKFGRSCDPERALGTRKRKRKSIGSKTLKNLEKE